MKNLTIIILAAGKGTRMNSSVPKVFQSLGGIPLIEHALNSAKTLNPKEIFLILNKNISKEDFNNENVVTLSYHVDYWNRLGWKDPYSDAMFSELQYQYNTAFGNRRVYTPQAIINGKEYYVGSRKQALYDAINKQLQTSSSNGLRIQSKDSGNDAVTFQYTIEGPLQDRTLHFSVALDQQTTAVKRGENRGEKLTNSNIVFVQKDLKPNSRKGEFTIQIPKKYQHTSNWVLTGYVQDPKMIIHAAHQIVL